MITADHYRVRIAQFVRSVTPALLERLDLAAQRFLKDHGLPDTPLHHSLGETPALGAGLPWGTLAVDIAELHRLVRNPVLSFTDVAGQLGITFDDVVETLGSHPAPVIFRDDHQRRARGGAFAAAKAQLSRSALVELYVGQGLGQAQIAARTGVSRQTVRRLLDRYGVAVHPVGRRRRAAAASTETSA
jgi:DNA-binding CsgD family transcriptional regulator